MPSMHRHRAAFAAALLLAATAGAHAQTARSGGDATARLQQMLQQANAEKAALTTENRSLKDKVESMEKELAGLKKERDGLAGRVNQAEGQAQRAEAGRKSVDANLDATQQRLQDVVAKYRELAETTRTIEGERNQSAGQLAENRRQLEACQAANVELAGIAEEALKRYEDKGVFAALAQKEPFTGIERARIGNLVDGYRSAVEAKRIAPATAP